MLNSLKRFPASQKSGENYLAQKKGPFEQASSCSLFQEKGSIKMKKQSFK